MRVCTANDYFSIIKGCHANDYFGMFRVCNAMTT